MTTPQSILVFGKGTPGLSLVNSRLSLTWGGTVTSTSPIVITDGRWHHVAMTVQNNGVSFVVDGQVYDNLSFNLPSSSVQTSSGTLQLGQAFGSNSAFSGSMTQVRVWSYKRELSEIQQTMNVQLNGKEDGLVGYWTFAGGKVVNLVNNQAGSVNGGAKIGTTSLDPAMYLYGLNAQSTFKVSSNITKGKTLGDNKVIDATVLGKLETYLQSAHIIPTPENDGTIPLPTTVNFITLPNAANANAIQLLSLIQTRNRLPPTPGINSNQTFANDTQILIPSGSNVVFALWDYMFFEYILAPALSKNYGIPASDINVTFTEPAVLSYSGTVTVNQNVTLTFIELSINSEGLNISVQANVLNQAITANFKGTLDVVVKQGDDCPPSDVGDLLFSLNNSTSSNFHEKLVFTMQNFNATDGSPECLTFSFKNVDVSLAWNPLNPNVARWQGVFKNFPIVGPCLGECCKGLLLLLSVIIEKIIENQSKTRPLDGDGKLEVNEIVFNDGFIVFGTAQKGETIMSSAFGPSGGVGGSTYNAPMPTSGGPWKISAVKGRSGSRIDQIEIVWSSAGGQQSSPGFGGSGDNPFTFSIAADDYLTQIKGSVGMYESSVRLFSLQFVTQAGAKSPVFGTASTSNVNYQCPPGYHITGIFGRSGSAVDALGVYIDPIV